MMLCATQQPVSATLCSRLAVCSEAARRAPPGADGPSSGSPPPHGSCDVHGCHPERGVRDGQPQPRLLAARLQVQTLVPDSSEAL